MITVRYQSITRTSRTTINRTAHTYGGALALVDKELVDKTKKGLDDDVRKALVTPRQPWKRDNDRESITLSIVP